MRLTTELVLVATVGVLGVAAGLDQFRDTVHLRSGRLGEAMGGIDQKSASVLPVTRDWTSQLPFAEAELSPSQLIALPDGSASEVQRYRVDQGGRGLHAAAT